MTHTETPAVPLTTDDIRLVLARASIAIRPLLDEAGPATLSMIIDHAMGLVNSIAVRSNELGAKEVTGLTDMAWSCLYDARKSVEDRAVA